MKTLLAITLIGVALGCLFVVAACESPAAQREQARAERIRAEAESYERQRAADVAAAAERANIRQMERDAAHQRAIEILPYLVIVLGSLFIASFGIFVVWDMRSLRRSQPTPADPTTLMYLERLNLDQAQMWRVLADLHRRSLPMGDHNIVDVKPWHPKR